MAFKAAAADTPLKRLRGLLGRIRFTPEDGLWLVPSLGVHTIGMLFPIDLVYLNAERRVIHQVEHLDPFRISPIRQQCSSILILPTRTIYSSHTRQGDELLICPPAEMQIHLRQEQPERSRPQSGLAQ